MPESDASALTSGQKKFVGKRVIRFADVLNTTGAYSFLRENGFLDQGKDALSGLVAGLLESKLNERFHTGLNFFEKLGFLSNAKLQNHATRVAFAKGAADFATRSLVDIIPMVVEHVCRSREFSALSDFFISWLAYINQQPSIAIQNRIVRLYEDNEREYDNDHFNTLFSEAITKKPGVLPPAPRSIREHPDTLFTAILGGCNLAEPAVSDRARECGAYLGLNDSLIGQHISIARDTGVLTSTLTGFAGFSVHGFFEDLAQNARHAQEAAVYSIENDPYNAMRVERKRRVLQGSVGLAAAALTFATGPAGDAVIVASVPIVLRLLRDEPTPELIVDVHKRFSDIRRKARAS